MNENWKQAYEEIPVPKEAQERIAAGICQAKREKQLEEQRCPEAGPDIEKRANRSGTSGGILVLKRAGTTAAAAMLAITLLTNVNPTIANAMEQIPVIGAIAKVVTFRNYENQTNHFEANIQVPQVEGGENAEVPVNKSIEEYADALIHQYEEELKASQGEGHYSLTSTYETVHDGERYVSLRINTTLVMAGGTQYVKIFTIDKATGQEISLKDMLGGSAEKLEAVSASIKEQMKAQMAADESVTYFLDSEVSEWDFQGLTGEESYYINDAGQLVVAFDEYQVAPGYMGAVEFAIPVEVTGEMEG